MTANVHPALHAHLSAHLGSLQDDYVGLLRERVAFYRAIPEERLKASVETLMRIFVDEAVPTGNAEPLVTWTITAFHARARQGLPIEGALALAACFRRAVLRSLGSVRPVNAEGLAEFMLFVDEFCETVTSTVVKFYTDALESSRLALGESEARYRGLVELSPDGVFVYREGRFLYGNPAGERLLGVDAAAIVGAEILSFFPADRRAEALARMLAAERSSGPPSSTEAEIMRRDGELITVELTGTSIVFEGLAARQIVIRDVTERRRTEEALKRAAVQEELLQAQEATLRALMTPLIPVSDGVVVMPLVGVFDQVRAEQIRQVLLDGIATTRAQLAILDVTGVPAMDAGVAAALLSAVAAARLLGAEVVLTGIKPAAATTLVGLGLDFGRVVTLGTLKDGIRYALGRAR